MKRYTFTASSGAAEPHTITMVGNDESLARLNAWVKLPSGSMRRNPDPRDLILISAVEDLIHTHEYPDVQSYLQWLLEAATHAQALYKLHSKRKAGPDQEALWDGYYALKLKAEEYAKTLTERGGLLFAFPGTAALKGGAE